MPRTCLLGCNIPGVSVHVFPNPAKFPERFKTWVNLVGGKLENNSEHELYIGKRICDIHFTESDKNRNNRLSALAIPSLHLPGKQHDYCDPRKTQHEDHSYYMHQKQLHAPKEHDNDADDFIQSSLPCQSDDMLQILEGDLNLQNKPFSWQNEHEVVPVLTDENNTEVIANSDNLSLNVGDDAVVTASTKDNIEGKNEDNHEGYQCNACNGDIVGYRYTCPQCANYDLCSACEASGVHPHHYVLRVPGPRPQNEIQTVLEGIRRYLNLYFKPTSDQCCDDDQISVKSETTEEPQEFNYINKTASISFTEASDDPLSIRNTPCDHLDDAISTLSSPSDNGSRVTQNFNPESESYDEVLHDKMEDEPHGRCADNINPLKRKMMINTLELVKVYNNTPILLNKRIRSIVRRRTSAMETTTVERSEEDNEDPEQTLKINELLPHKGISTTSQNTQNHTTNKSLKDILKALKTQVVVLKEK